MSPRMGLDTQTLVRSAAELADSGGLEQVTLASLAKKLNIRTPSLYNHIDGLPDLRRKLAAYGLKSLHDRLSRAVEGMTEGGDRIGVLSRAYLAFAREHPGLYEATLRAPEPGEAEVQAAAADVMGLVVQAIASYGLDVEDQIHAVRGLRSILHGFASLEQRGGFGLPYDLDESFARTMNTFLSGLRSGKN